MQMNGLLNKWNVTDNWDDCAMDDWSDRNSNCEQNENEVNLLSDTKRRETVALVLGLRQ